MRLFVKLFDHFWIKIISLALGLLLWFHVATEHEYSYEVKLPVTGVALNENLTLAQEPPESLLVVVSATGKQLLRRAWRQQGIRIVGSEYSAGTHRVPLTLTNTFLVDNNVQVALNEIVAPKSARLVIDEMDIDTISVVPAITVEPAEGYAVAGMSRPRPPAVEVRGPRSLVSQYKSIATEQRHLDGVRTNIELRLALVTPSGYSVTLQPDSVDVVVELVPVKTRVFEKIPIVVYNAPRDSAITTNPAYLRVEVTGPPAEIDLLNKNAIVASTDYRQAGDSGLAEVKIDCPVRFRVRTSSADTVRLIPRAL